MNLSNNIHPTILDLPNEILFLIINKLNIGDVVYSLMNLDQRFLQLVFDPFYIQNLNITVMTMNSYYNRSFSINEQVLSRICENILPYIHNQIKNLVIEQQSIERILTFNYSQLYSLSLVNINEDTLFQYLTDHSNFRQILTQQITHLNIDIQTEKKFKLSKISSNIFVLILSLCKRLIKLNFCQLFSYRNFSIRIYKEPTTSYISPTLTELKINVATLSDIFYLLDGNFDSLSKLIINVKKFKHVPPYIYTWGKLPQIKCFSLTSSAYMCSYDEDIVPLLHRMINLEELTLFLCVGRIDSTVIDGTELYEQVLSHMPYLNKFVFSIHTVIQIRKNEIQIPSNENIQHSFIRREYGEVDSYVHFEPRKPIDGSDFEIKAIVKTHIYSLPYQFESFINLNNSFQGGMFVTVRCLRMIDAYSFEHRLFKIISNDFHFLEELTIKNRNAKKEKQQSSTLIHFHYLNLLNLVDAHVDYAEQFLVNTTTHLPCLLDLSINYKSLTMVTNNFTNDATRLYCSKLKGLHTKKPLLRPEHFDEYFPLLL